MKTLIRSDFYMTRGGYQRGDTGRIKASGPVARCWFIRVPGGLALGLVLHLVFRREWR